MTYRYMKNEKVGLHHPLFYVHSATLEAGDGNEQLARTILEDVLQISPLGMSDTPPSSKSPCLLDEDAKRVVQDALTKLDDTGLIANPPDFDVAVPDAAATAPPPPPTPTLSKLNPPSTTLEIYADSNNTTQDANASSSYAPGNDDTDDSFVVNFKHQPRANKRSPPPPPPATLPTPVRSTPFVSKAAMSARSKRRMSIRRRLAAAEPVAGPRASAKKKGAGVESSDDDTNEMKKHVERTAHLLAKKHVSERPTITRTPLLRKGPGSALKSGAKRVDSSMGGDEDEYDDDEEEEEEEEDSMSPVSVKAKKGKEAKSSSKSKSKKITKNDLAYMMSWDPTKKTPAKSSDKSKSSSVKARGTPGISRNGTVEMAKIDEDVRTGLTAKRVAKEEIH